MCRGMGDGRRARRRATVHPGGPFAVRDRATRHRGGSMSTRDTVVAALALTEDILGPHLVPAPVRHRPAGPHRPGGTALLTFTGRRAADTARSGTAVRSLFGDR